MQTYGVNNLDDIIVKTPVNIESGNYPKSVRDENYEQLQNELLESTIKTVAHRLGLFEDYCRAELVPIAKYIMKNNRVSISNFDTRAMYPTARNAPNLGKLDC